GYGSPTMGGWNIMAFEDFGPYTEVDPNSRITKTTRRVTWALLARNEDAYVYNDKGVDYFNGNFVHFLTYRPTGGAGGTSSGIGGAWSIANTVDDLYGIDIGGGSYLSLFATVSPASEHNIYLEECDSGTVYDSAAYTLTINTDYYLSIQRDESIGTYGTLYCYIYSNAARTTLLQTLSVALHTSKKDFRYIFTSHSQSGGTASDTHSGYSENLELFGASDPGVLPILTVQPLTDITGATATGNGTITDLGISAVTAHGYVWDNTIDPTTADSSSGFWGSTDSGAGSLGIFESSITGLLAGQEYYARPYATNGAGTSYGANVYFIAGQPGTLRIKGEFAVVK
ncbi:hypothetical protein LCGC14_3122740, partial [marine sediment metagenome]